jgi:hypothetical protein
VFDGVLAHIAGTARLSLNERGARPNTLKAPSPAFPFADAALRDPITGKTDGLLDNPRARANQPKIFYTMSRSSEKSATYLRSCVTDFRFLASHRTSCHPWNPPRS